MISVEGLLQLTTAYLNRIATAVPEHDVHDAFVVVAEEMLADPQLRTVFRRMVRRANIAHRYSFLDPQKGCGHFSSHDAHEFYRLGNFPDTARRMELFEQSAPVLMRKAVDRLALNEKERSSITHVLVTCCTGLYAPGLDFEIVDHLGLSPGVERTMVGFMGCYAAINALKLARHIVRSDPQAAVLMVNLELCTLHLQQTQELEQVLSFLIFADGAAASLITACEQGFALDSFKAMMVPETRGLITWKIRGLGFDMMLSGQVPAELARALHEGELMAERDGIDLWAVHPGGRSDSGCGGEGTGAAGRCAGRVPRGAIVLRQHVVGDDHVCAAADDAAGAAWAARVCDVVWSGAHSGDDAIPCGLVRRSTSDSASLRVNCRS